MATIFQIWIAEKLDCCVSSQQASFVARIPTSFFFGRQETCRMNLRGYRLTGIGTLRSEPPAQGRRLAARLRAPDCGTVE
jgi:hypothetical protein